MESVQTVRHVAAPQPIEGGRCKGHWVGFPVRTLTGKVRVKSLREKYILKRNRIWNITLT